MMKTNIPAEIEATLSHAHAAILNALRSRTDPAMCAEDEHGFWMWTACPADPHVRNAVTELARLGLVRPYTGSNLQVLVSRDRR